MKYLLLKVAAVFVALSLGTTATHANGKTPLEVIDGFHAVLLETMQNAKSLGYKGRYEKLRPAIEQAFNLPLMARVVAGKHWSKMNDADKQTLTNAFSRMTIATYAARFKGYGGEKFQTLGQEDVRRRTLLVKTQLVTSEEPVGLSYLMRESAKGWMVIDIYLKGTYSELATRRSEYSSLLGRDGLQQLVALIEKRVKSYEAGNDGS